MSKIAVVTMSRGNPHGLVSTIAGLRALESGHHTVDYYVCCDNDDPETVETAARIGTKVHVGPRPDTIGQAWNSAAAASAKITDWDAFCMMADDITPTSRDWDMTVARAMKLYDVVSWTERGDPYNPTLPILSRNYYEKVGNVSPEWFLAWFMDTWVAEVQQLAHGFCPIISDLTWYGDRGKTKSLRELPFWIRVFASTRDLRCREAEKLSGGTLHKGVIKEREANDAWLLDNAQMLECTFGTGEPPDERYLRAKKRAADFMERELVE
jgi:hypothetical protein